MKNRSVFLRASLACVMSLSVFGLMRAAAQGPTPKPSDAEVKAARAVESAADAAAKLTAGEEFVKSFPKGQLRQGVAEHIASQISSVKDQAQKMALVKKFQTVFNTESEARAIRPVLIEAYIGLNQIDEAFSNGASYLAKNPDDVAVLTTLALAAIDQATKHNNPKYVNEGGQYGTKAIALLEAPKPAGMSDEEWGGYQKNLPPLYQQMAIVSLMNKETSKAQSQLEKSQKLNPSDPFTYYLLGSIADDEYTRAAQTIKNMPEGKQRDDLLKQAMGLMDKVIDYYAHAVGLSEGKPDYQKFHDQLLQYLASYYKYRHNNSVDGMQKMIDGYKPAVTP